jgi:hypothetical protein
MLPGDTAGKKQRDFAGHEDPPILQANVPGWHGMACSLPPFLVQQHRPSRAAWPQIFHLHLQRRSDARERIAERGDQGR